MVGAMILATAMPLWQAVSPDLQQAVQEEVQQELRRGRFRFGGGGGTGVEVLVPIAFFAMIAGARGLSIIHLRERRPRPRAISSVGRDCCRNTRYGFPLSAILLGLRARKGK